MLGFLECVVQRERECVCSRIFNLRLPLATATRGSRNTQTAAETEDSGCGI